MSERLPWIDTLKGIGILLVVLGHTYIPEILQKYIYSFHMPLFFYISGYLHSQKQHTFKDFLQKKYKSLIVPYILFTIISVIIMLLRAFWGNKENISLYQLILQCLYIDDKVIWNTPIWFLVVLFIVENLFYFIVKKKLLSNLLIMFSFILIGLVFAFYSIKLSFGLSIACIALSFYNLGYLSKKYYIIQYLVNKKKFILGIIISFLLNILFGLILNDRVDMYKISYGDNFISFYIAAIAGIIFWIYISHIISKNEIFNYLGNSSLIILGTHYFIFYFISVIELKVIKYNYHLHASIAGGVFDTILTVVCIVCCQNMCKKLIQKYKS
jgi:acyltransferase